jgi:signal transduction histidine kinase
LRLTRHVAALTEALQEQLEERKLVEEALRREKSEQQTLIQRLEEAHNQLLQSEKMASIGQLAAGVAHEINNPIGYVNSNLGSLQKYVEALLRLIAAYEKYEADLSQEHAESLQTLKNEIDLAYLREDINELMTESLGGLQRVKRIVQDLKDFSHVSDSEIQWANVESGLESTLNVVWNELKYKAEVIRDYAPALPRVACLPAQINQVVMNLLVNAAHAIVQRGTITVRTGFDDAQVWIEVSDTGQGMPPAVQKRIFDPFYTTKPAGKGTGLGLSISYDIVAKHGGRIEVSSAPGAGSTFRVCLPRQGLTPRADPPPPASGG